ncbi:MAG: hypothetical protein WAZ10_02030, partial [Minisyncoccia bacterium]
TAHSEKKKSRAKQIQAWEAVGRGRTTERERKRAERLSARSARWSGRYGVTEFIVTSPLTFWKKVRAKDRISPPTKIVLFLALFFLTIL